MQSGAASGRVVGGRWVLGQQLGAGGMGTVYAARGPDGQPRAVKLLHASLCSDEVAVTRFFGEAAATERIAHPSVVRIYDRGVDAHREVYLVMELLRGKSLAEGDAQHLARERILFVAQQVLQVLAIAHRQGIVHRDIKPSNLFLTDDGRVVVLDFGIARIRDELSEEMRTRTGVTLGSLPYMPPEQAAGRQSEVDGKSDLFALGATLFQLVAGRRIRAGLRGVELLMAAVEQAPPPITSVAPAVDPGLAALIDRALAFSPSDRYANAETMLADVDALSSGGQPAHALARAGSPPSRGLGPREATRAPASSHARDVADGVPKGPADTGSASGGRPSNWAAGPQSGRPSNWAAGPQSGRPSNWAIGPQSGRPSDWASSPSLASAVGSTAVPPSLATSPVWRRRLPFAVVGLAAGVGVALLFCGLSFGACWTWAGVEGSRLPAQTAREILEAHARGMHPWAGKDVRVSGQVVKIERTLTLSHFAIGIPGQVAPAIDCVVSSPDDTGLGGAALGSRVVVDGKMRRKGLVLDHCRRAYTEE